MKKLLTAANRLLHPPMWVRLVLSPAVFAALVYAFAAGQERSALAYPVFCMSAYCLTILILPLPEWIRRTKSTLIQRVSGSAFGGRYLHNLAFRGSVSIYQGMTVNFFYVVFRVAAGIRYASVWFISMAVYYLVLGCLRAYLIVCYRRRDPELERRCYRITAWLLFLLNIPMGGMIVQMVLAGSGYSYPGYVIYLSAMYTFYTLAMSVVNLVKFRKLGSPILSAAKILNFIAALMSILGLQTAMIAQFSAEDAHFRQLMNAITGGFVYGIVILIAIIMLLHSRKSQKEAAHIE